MNITFSKIHRGYDFETAIVYRDKKRIGELYCETEIMDGFEFRPDNEAMADYFRNQCTSFQLLKDAKEAIIRYYNTTGHCKNCHLKITP